MENVKSKRSALVSFVLVFALLATLLYGGLLQTKAADWFYVTYDYCGGTSPKGNATERTTNGGQNFSLSDKFGTAPKDGMRIFGWYLDKDYSEEGKLIEYRNEVHNYRDGDPHAETILREKGDTTIYARWGYGYNVTVTNAVIVPEGRVYTENTYYGEKGKPVHIEELVYGPEKESDEGKLFGGYYTKPNGEGTLVTPAVVYREEAYGGYEEFVWPYYVIDLEFQADQDVTLYAYWTDGYTMTYDANGGVGGTKKSMQAPFIKVDDTSLEKPTREGYTLIGWSESKDGKNAFQLKDYVVSKDVTLYAVWEKNTTPDPTPTPTPTPTPVVKQNGLADSADSNGDWWFYKDGKIDKTHNGVDQNKYGWWRVENGKVNFNAQGIYQNGLGWWKTTNGKVTFKEQGIYQNGFGWWKCKDSKVDFTAQSVYQNQFGWWKTKNGKVTFKENGLFKNQYGTWKVESSKVNFNFNGTYQGKTIKNGKVL